MEAESRYVWVGAAVLTLIAALVAAVVWLKNIGGEGEFNRYTIHFEQQALDGLEVGADVSLRGIKVGRVDDYALAIDRVNRVRVEVRVDRRAPLHTNTVAIVTRNIVTGIASIALVTRDPPGEILTQVPSGERHPVIGEGRSDLAEIAGRVNKVGEMATASLASINQLLSAENRDNMMATVRSLRDLADGINQRLGTLETTLQRVGKVSVEVG
ncbi:MAG: MlaD family protein, partial [Rubrivivax sp.]|nr:MlaD family protein [Rubrivivax sp.]